MVRMWKCVPSVEMFIGSATVENSMEVSQKAKNRTTIWPSNSTPEYISGKNWNSNSKKKYMHPDVHRSIIYSCQGMEAT